MQVKLKAVETILATAQESGSLLWIVLEYQIFLSFCPIEYKLLFYGIQIMFSISKVDLLMQA